MIVKIWPIKSSYNGAPGKVSGIRGLKNAVDYVRNDDKCMVKESNMDRIILADDDSDSNMYSQKEPGVTQVTSYMANNDKVKGKYISGYMCNVDDVAGDFIATKNRVLGSSKEKKKDGNIAYHLVQSFPQDIDISDEEVHECGMELIRKLDKYQAFLCSHVHPEIDEEGVIHGKSKHNHILINAYMMPEKIDPDRPNLIKYNDSKESYRQLQIWNDEIALEHGFPIIRTPDSERMYSWQESEEANKGLSWKHQIRNDIDLAKQKARNWDEFLKEMNRLGYTVKDGKHITYIAPDGKHRARSKSLGERFSKENIQQYWDLRAEIRRDVLSRENEQDTFTIKDILSKAEQPLFVMIPLGGSNNPKGTTYPLSLDKKILSQDSINSYFDMDRFYEIQNKEGQIIDSVNGLDLYNYYTGMLKSEKEKIRQLNWWANEQEKRRWLRVQEEQRKEKQYYENRNFRNSKTGRTYKVGLYTSSGRLKTELELNFTIAIAVINHEYDDWQPRYIPKDRVKEAYFGPRDWKAQNMMDAIQIAREEGIDNRFDIANRLQITGAALSRAKAAVNRNTGIRNKMETLKNAIDMYEETRFEAQRILDMPDSDEKLRMLHSHKDVIDNYTKARRIMHMNKVEKPEDIFDFKKRYAQVEQNIKESELLLDEKKEDYRRLKKLEYSTSLAQDPRFCYGPEYSLTPETEIDYEHSEPPIETDI